ncbi:hypothetical protein Snoj_79540 [Streptomyces nojiriensis]|uniref:Uncharacterized protein n=1 Tax=Streptomyces nojiriensis TaxID=66374 RepID=A0ABQ3T0Z0_9ACTN|nr:hypothetical protein GCM10010205_02770 [Streptomyces nojiriensis]GHI74036.1 hypothetical protein Snoj_79540 [Streptomyces nojiriensis]
MSAGQSDPVCEASGESMGSILVEHPGGEPPGGCADMGSGTGAVEDLSVSGVFGRAGFNSMQD